MTLLSLVLLNASEAASNFDYKLLATLASSLSGAVIGGFITIWYKREEIKNQTKELDLQSQNLDIQRKTFEQSVIINELQMKAELVRLEDLNRQFKLSLEKYDLEHLAKIIEIADDKNDKIKMMREFSEILSKYKSSIPNSLLEDSDYKEFVVSNIYDKLDDIKNEIEGLLSKYPDVFLSVQKEFKDIAEQASSLIFQSYEFYSYHDEFDKSAIVERLFNDLYDLHTNYINLIDVMKEEFKEVESIRRNYIRDQFASRILK